MPDRTMTGETALPTLPRGRHRLGRDDVARSQRWRLLQAMADALAERGYVATPVAEILRRAGVSRQTFYEQFSSKEECFIAVFEASVDALLKRMGDALESGDGPDERFSRVLRAYLDMLADEPAYARVFLIEVYAAGPAVFERRVAVQQRFTDLVADLLEARTAEERFACEALIAAISSMVTARLGAGDLDGLRALHDPIVELVRTVRAARAA